MKTIYLAGPDVFRENPLEHFDAAKKLCSKYGFKGLSPFDNEGDFHGVPLSKEHSRHIFMGNTGIIKVCDIILANLIAFKDACVDDGTAWELGCGYAYGKLLYGYTPFVHMTLPKLTEFWAGKLGEFPGVESFGTNSVNLMIQDSIELSGGKILGSFEECLIDILKTHGA